MSTAPRVLFVTPNWRWDETPLAVDTLRPPIAPPLEFAYVAAGLSCERRLVDAYAADLDPTALTEETAAFSPTHVVVSTTPSALYWRCPPLSIDAVSAAVRAIGAATAAPVTAIGPHATISPEWLRERTGVTACFRGAPERGLAEALMRGDDALVGGSSAITVVAAPQLPRADVSVFDFDLPYAPHMWTVSERDRALVDAGTTGSLLESSRGCPWACAYCAKAPIRDRYARRPLEAVTEELDALIARGVGYVFFIDETFNIPGDHTNRLLDVLAERPIAFGFQGRADVLKPSAVAALERAGCVYVELGVDTVADDLAGTIGRNQRTGKAMAGVELCRERIPIVRFNRINLSTFDYRVRLGLCGERDWDVPPDPAYPYPGAPLGERLMRLYKRTAFDWEFAEQYSWWLRIEVHLQRTIRDLRDEDVRRAQQAFLALSREHAREIAADMSQAADGGAFLHANKFLQGKAATWFTSSSRPVTRPSAFRT